MSDKNKSFSKDFKFKAFLSNKPEDNDASASKFDNYISFLDKDVKIIKNK